MEGWNNTSWTPTVLATGEMDWNLKSVRMAQAWKWILSRWITSFSARVWQVHVSQEDSTNRKKVLCALIFQRVWHSFSQQGLPQHTHTHNLEVWGWGHSYGNAFKKGRHIWRVLVRKSWLHSATGWGYLRDLYFRLYPLSVTLVENKLEFCCNYDNEPLCCA